MAKKFSPVQAIGRPTSLAIESGIADLERGKGLFLNATGQVTTVYANASAYTVVGLADDIQTNPERYNVVNEEVLTSMKFSGAATTTTGITLAHANVDSTPGLAGSGILLAATVTTYLKIAGVWTLCTGTIVTTVTSKVNGVISQAITAGVVNAAPVDDATYDAKIILSYSYDATTSLPLGAQTELDMFGSNTTAASKLCTVYFEPGLYVCDSYDPYVVYTPGLDVYVKDGGWLTSANLNSSNGKCGKVIKAPATNYSAEQQVVNNHLGSPELLTLWLNI